MRELRSVPESNQQQSIRPLGAAQSFRSPSWGGVIAGVCATVAVQLLLNLLGIGIGASSINAARGNQPGQGMAIGAVLWFVVSWILSLVVGGWTASQFASHEDRRTAALQGFLVWAVASIVVVYLLSTAAGNLIGGTASVLGRTAALVGSGAQSTVPGVAGVVSRVTGITPETISAQAGEIASDPEFQGLISHAIQSGDFTPQDREAINNLLMRNGRMTHDEANQTVEKWQLQVRKGASAAKAAALTVEDKAASGISATGFGSFVSLLLGLAAAVAGGMLSTHRRFSRAWSVA